MNALMRLNQIRPGLQYRLLSQSGPVHAPLFTMSVDLDGTVHQAAGSSKKTAKLHVAVKVVWAWVGGWLCVCVGVCVLGGSVWGWGSRGSIFIYAL